MVINNHHHSNGRKHTNHLSLARSSPPSPSVKKKNTHARNEKHSRSRPPPTVYILSTTDVFFIARHSINIVCEAIRRFRRLAAGSFPLVQSVVVDRESRINPPCSSFSRKKNMKTTHDSYKKLNKLSSSHVSSHVRNAAADPSSYSCRGGWLAAGGRQLPRRSICRRSITANHALLINPPIVRRPREKKNTTHDSYLQIENSHLLSLPRVQRRRRPVLVLVSR